MIKILKEKWNTPEIRALIIRFIKFLSVGGTVFCIQTFFAWFFIRVLQTGNIPGLSFAYMIAITSHFLLNNFITFKSSTEKYSRRIIGYILITISNYFIVTFLGNFVLTSIIDNIPVTTIITTSITTIYSFILQNKVVYKTSKKVN